MKDQIDTITSYSPMKNPNLPVQPQGEPVKQTFNYWKGISIVLCILLLGFGGFYVFTTKGKQRINRENSQILNIPTTDVPSNAHPATNTIDVSLQSNQIRTNRLILSYPNNLIPVFAPTNNSKSVVYFAKTPQEAQTLADCVTKGCSTYALKLEDFSNAAVWTNYNVEGFIKQARPDIQLSKLQKTTLGGREAWSGYTDENNLTYQTVIVTDSSQAKSFIAIIANASDKQTMEEYVSRLQSVVINEYQEPKTSELTVKNSFIITLTSSFITEDYSLLSFLLGSLLAPQNSTKVYHYQLYTETKNNPDSDVGGPNFPKGNYLNNTYYLLTDNDQIKEGVYGTSQVQIRLTLSPIKNLGQYFADPKYCQQDSDCHYRSNFCTIGAYNMYHQFLTPWGCGPGNYEGLGNSLELEQKLGCQNDVTVKYDALKCVSNACQAIHQRPVCK